MTTTAGRATTAAAPARRAAASPTLPFTERVRARIGYLLLAAVAYVPLLLTQPGKVAADTKTYLYLDPGRLLSRAPSMWDPNIGLGTVTHQTIGYLFPMGPFYWVLETGLGLPSWVAQRLWLGTLLVAAGLGMRFLLRTLGLRGPGVVVGLLAFMLTPYLLDYSARISVILGPWAALPWMVALVVLALRHGGWRYPALFALVVQLVGGVNATALFAGIAPALWLPYSVWVTREATVRRAFGVLWRTGLLTLVTSLWWIAGLWAQGGYGLDILKFTETVQSVSKTSFPGEIMRGLGYWFFYGQDKVGPWTESAKNYTQHLWLILVSYLIPVLALLSAAFIKWRYRTYFILVTLVGVTIAVGAEPYSDPTALGSVFKAFANSSSAGLALRSTGRAVPLVVLGIAALLACGVNSLATWFNGRGLGVYGLVAAGLVGFLLLLNFPSLWDGTYYGKNLERPENIPTYWTDAIKYLDAQSHDTRIMELPGADFASYRWGNTVDPITPGLTDRPYVARELIPWGSPPSANLLNAFDRQLQEQLLDPASIAPIARKMSVGDVTLRMDVQTDRYNLIRPQLLWQMFSPSPPSGLGDAKIFGTGIPGQAKFPQIDEQVLGATKPFPNPPPVAVLPVEGTLPIIRATPAAKPLVVDGDGEGLVDVAATGLVDANHAVFYSGSYADDPAALRARLGSDATLVVTDTNRKRALRWSTVRDNYGYTEQAGEKPLVEDASDARLDVFPGASDSAYTVTEQRGVKSVQASHYGNPVSYTAEDRAERALDGDPFTAWKVGAFANVDGERMQIQLDHPITTDQVNLLQPLNGPRDRYITTVTLTFDGKHSVVRTLGPASRSLDGTGENVKFPKRKFSTLDIRIDATNVGKRFQYGGASAVGFSEVRLRDDKAGSKDVRVDEVIRMPSDLLHAAGPSSLGHPLVFVMTRDRQYPTPPRYDPELNLTRAFTLPTDRAFAVDGTIRVNATAPDDVIDQLVGIPGLGQGGIRVVSSEYLDGDPRSRGSAAFDGDPTTAWSTKFANATDQWVQVTTDASTTFDHLDLQVVADGRHSLPVQLEISSDDGTKRRVDLPAITDRSTPNATVPVPVRFAPITGHTFRVTITSIRPVHTLEYFSASEMAMPVAIAEVGIPGVRRAPQPAELPSVCRTDLLSLDGKPFGVLMSGSTADALAYRPLPLRPCSGNSVAMKAGDHLVRSRNGGTTGLDVDQVVLSSQAGGAAAPVSAIAPGSSPGTGGALGASRPAATTAASGLEVVHSGRTSATLRVAHPTAPFWLVLGQSQNQGWTATANGKDLGEPQLVDGYANGWLVKPAKDGGAITLRLDWTPQRTVWVAIWLSVVGGLVCIGLIVAGMLARRRHRTPAPASNGEGAVEAGYAPPPELATPLVALGHRVSAPVIVGTTVLATVLGGVLIRPWCGVLTGGATLLVLVRPRLRAVLSLFPFLALGLCGLYAAASQYHYHVGPIFEWPTQLWRVRTLGWLAVVFFACDALVEIVRTHRAPGVPPPDPGV